MTRSDIYHQLPLLHHSYRGLREDEAEFKFMKEAQRLKEYGTLFYQVSRVIMVKFSHLQLAARQRDDQFPDRNFHFMPSFFIFIFLLVHCISPYRLWCYAVNFLPLCVIQFDSTLTEERFLVGRQFISKC